jgi:hypothetical protein
MKGLVEEQDLGVVVQDNLKCAKQCEKVVTMEAWPTEH